MLFVTALFLTNNSTHPMLSHSMQNLLTQRHENGITRQMNMRQERNKTRESIGFSWIVTSLKILAQLHVQSMRYLLLYYVLWTLKYKHKTSPIT